MPPRSRCLVVLLTLGFVASLFGQAPPTEVLWPDGAPGAAGTEAEDRPSLTVYLPPPDEATGTAVVVCPGGGYGHLAMDHEGHQVAQWLNDHGVAAFVLTYRLGPRYRHPAPLQDVQRALRHVRYHAERYDIDPDRLGVWGFSAGGHLAASASTLFDMETAEASDAIDRLSARPNFAILAYPVITLRDPFAHAGSRERLLGDAPNPALVARLSLDQQVTAETPPTFLFHTTTDQAVPVQNSLDYYRALVEADVPAELHVYERGRHGVGLAPDDAILSTWTDRLAAWLRLHGWIGEIERLRD